MTLQIAFAPLELEPKEFTAGDTIRVTFTFKYTVGVDVTITLQAVPYQYRLGILDRIGASADTKELRLASASDETVQESIDFTLAGISSGTYGLMVEVLGTNYGAKADGILIVAGTPDMFSSMMPMLMMLMMLGMVMPMMQGMGEEEIE